MRMKYLIILISFTVSLFIAFLAFIKKSYKYATIQDNVDNSNDYSKLKQSYIYKDKNNNQIMLTNKAPLDYEVK